MASWIGIGFAASVIAILLAFIAPNLMPDQADPPAIPQTAPN